MGANMEQRWRAARRSPAVVGTLLLGLAGAPGAQLFEVAKLTADDAGDQARFGTSVALSGSTALIGTRSPLVGDVFGAPVFGPGAAYVFERQPDGTWFEAQKLMASDTELPNEFGHSVSLSGDRALVGAYRDNAPALDSGAAYVFERQLDGVWIESQKLTAAGGEAFDYFGYAVSIAGDHAVVGAPFDDDLGPLTGSAYVFERQPGGSWTQVQKLIASNASAGARFGHSAAVAGDRAVVGALLGGAAYVFERQPGGSWVEVAVLTAADAGAQDHLGGSVAVGLDRALVGAPGGDGVAVDAGAAYAFEPQQGGGWTQVAKLVAGDGEPGDDFGGAVALAGDRALVGAPGYDTAAVNPGAAYVFERQPDGSWVEAQVLTAGDGSPSDHLGDAVAASGQRVLAGAYFDDELGPAAGSAYAWGPSLDSDVGALSLAAGGVQQLSLHAGPALAGTVHLVLGSLNGTAPGIAVDAVVLPLNADAYLLFTLAHPNAPPLASSLGVLDAEGHGTAAVALPPLSAPGLAGLTFHHAFLAFDPAAGAAVFASAPAALTLTP